jgi:hypothetical protein
VFAGLIAGLSQHLKNATPLSTARWPRYEIWSMTHESWLAAKIIDPLSQITSCKTRILSFGPLKLPPSACLPFPGREKTRENDCDRMLLCGASTCYVNFNFETGTRFNFHLRICPLTIINPFRCWERK